ncbi:MAG: TIGR02594 family protein [Mesorhizobium sp.]|nr:MAG: TIGR02594 family protein [Mesorhizobium sp.]
MSDPAWLSTAKKYLGQREVHGPQHNPHVLQWWKNMGAPFKDDETPWCGAFVGGVLVETGIKPVAGDASAQAWLKLPVKIPNPAVGCVVVFWRKSPTSGLRPCRLFRRQGPGWAYHGAGREPRRHGVNQAVLDRSREGLSLAQCLSLSGALQSARHQQ